MQTHYIIRQHTVTTSSAVKGTYYAVRIDESGDRTTVIRGVSENDAFTAAQADATKLSLNQTLIAK